MHNAGLATKLNAIINALEGIEDSLATLAARERERIVVVQSRPHSRPLIQSPPVGRDAADWPWTPDTVSQGFLAGRWLRRDGNVYGAGALRGVRGPNSPIAGGQDNQAKVDVPSGAPKP